ncbi:metal-dependent hydrolase of the beta-lactamase superfamily III [Enterocytozoon bieneusi H348]|nr:metal-dependent hydrolase of the beta-lactamase superfamily III [Enterocytozoon bieneusi H348]|eukprot:XP_002649385.1 metal-dependent hydrolase of the beta-lactamase superfamily III [Enterocytozoon bieneusi H348]
MDIKTVILLKDNISTNEVTNYLSNYTYEINNNIILVNCEPSQLTDLENISHIEITTNYNIEKILTKNIKIITLNPIIYNYDWIINEYFIIQQHNTFELLKLDTTKIKKTLSIDNIQKFCISNCGNIFGFIKHTEIKFFANETLDLFYNLDINESIENCIFSNNDKYIAIQTSTQIIIFEFAKAKHILSIDYQPFTFFMKNNKIYLNLNNNEIIDIENHTKKAHFKNYEKSKIYTGNGMYAEYICEDKMQIIKTEFISKNYINITDIHFYFTTKKIFAVITKKIGNTNQFYIDIFNQDQITTIVLKLQPISFNFTDDTFVIVYTNNQIDVFEKKGYGFRCIKTINKLGEVLTSINNSVLVIYDIKNEILEFYNNGSKVASYTHKLCSNLIWSTSGLYLAAYSSETKVESGGMVQIFNIDGKLCSKQIFTGLNALLWRPYITNKSKYISIPYDLSKDNDDIEYSSNESDLLSIQQLTIDWIQYLKSKIV